MKDFLDEAAEQDHPLRALKEFLEQEKRFENSKQYNKMSFVGYVLEIGYDHITIITSDPYKLAVGGVPRNSLLIMCPASFENNEDVAIPLHFTLLRVLDSAPTPLSNEIQQTYFELQKKSMPELDRFTQSELQWGALKTKVLGMFYKHPEEDDQLEFSGDLHNYVSGHKYKVYSPNDPLLKLISNSLVPNENRFQVGKLRLTECRLSLPDKPQPNIDIYLSTTDFMGCRTAMFGKTRLGKSNVVKLIIESLLKTTKNEDNVGQLIFDINGEYANDNPQDNNISIRSAYEDRCIVYALTPKESTPSKELKIDFYTNPSASHKIIKTQLQRQGRNAIYIESFLSVSIPNIQELSQLEYGKRNRAKRKILIYWAILKKAGFDVDERLLKGEVSFGFQFNEEAMEKIFGKDKTDWIKPNSLDELITFFEQTIEKNSPKPLPSSNKDKDLLDADEIALLNFLRPATGAGPYLLQGIRKYHSTQARDFTNDILQLLDEGKTVILDLGNADEEIMQYFSRELSEEVFWHQTKKFTENRLGNHFIQLYFEEAHNLFKNKDDSADTEIYRRFAKEGAKYHIGMVYSTQSPTTINPDLLAQTENFFVAHLASQDDVNRLARLNIAYESLKEDILNAKTIGYIRMLTRSHRFVISMQALKFHPSN